MKANHPPELTNGPVDPPGRRPAGTRPLVLHARVVTGAGGGPEKTILNTPRFLEAAGYSTLCVYMRDPRDGRFAELERRALECGAPLVAVDDRGPFDWRIVGRLRGICRHYHPLIWHGHEYKSNLLGLLLRRERPMRLLTTVHGWVERSWKTPLYYAIDRLCLRRYDGVICVSEDIHRTCLSLGIASERCWLVPNGIDTETYRRRQPAAEAKRRLGVAAGRLLIGAAGRLSREKGFELLIRAVARLMAEGVDCELWIAGDGPRRVELERSIHQLGLEERVKLLGYHSQMLDLYHALDLFVLSSVREGLPNVLLEAMALELPVLATRVAGVPGLLRDGENGLLVDPGSVDALVAGLRRLARGPSLRHRLGKAGRQTVARSCSFRQRMESVREIYAEVIARGDGGADGHER